MTAPILIAYATRYGSTREVAEAIAATLRERGLTVDVQPARSVHTLAGYGAAVLGAPFYVGSWHRDAQRFLAQHREALQQRPFAIFALGPLSSDEKELLESREQFDKELAKYPDLRPVALEMFSGKYDPAKLSIPHRLLTVLPASPLHGLAERDLRDWNAIRAWASGLAAKLQPVVSK
jgi:menaquinone-dependent protoporphyrinogen oxidase